MTRINGSGSGAAGQGSPGSSGNDSLQTRPQLFAQQDARANGFAQKHRSDAKAVTSARAAAFHRSIEVAETKASEEPTASTLRQGGAEQSAGFLGWANTDRSSNELSAPQGAVAYTALEPAIATLVERIEQAFRADLLATAGRPDSIRIELANLVQGLDALTVTMTDLTIDVVLSRGASAPSEELTRAVQTLADKLHQRFGRRTVRVMDDLTEGVATLAVSEADGMQAISRILGNQRS